MRKFYLFSILYSLLWSLPVLSQQTLKVNLSSTVRPVTHCASGSLYGVTETLPADIANLVAPLKPCVFTQPALSGTGHQQPIGAALTVSSRLANTTGKVMIRLADILPGWPYTWPGQSSFLSSVTSVINSKKSSGRTNYYGYEIWNEPDGTWKTANGDFHATCWKPSFDLIRSLDPGAKIIGPSYSYYSSSSMKTFLTYCKNNNCLPDIICWHQWGSASISSTIDSYRALEVSLGISPRAISINEYSSKTSDPYEGCPGYSVPFIAKFERKMVESACISWWFTNLPGRLGSLLTAKNEKGGGWHLYKWYGDMTGNMMSVTPPNDNSDGIDGFACLDQSANYASICLGGNYTGAVNVVINGIPSFFGSKVNASLEYVTWSNKDTPVSATTTISTTSYTVTNGSVTVPVNISSPLYAYRVYLTPVQTNQAPTVVLTAPANKATYTAPANINLAATAKDADGTIAKVEFYNGTAKLGEDASSPYTYSWTNVVAGSYILSAVATDNSGNKTTSSPDTIKVNVPQGPYNGIVHLIPGTIQVEEYDLGGNGIAYNDDSPGSDVTPNFNYRSDEDVDIEICKDANGGYNLGFAKAGEWLEYTVNVAASGDYQLEMRVSCDGEGRTISLTMDGNNIANNIAIPNTAGWQAWTTTKVDNVPLTEGQHVLRMTVGATSYVNVNYLTFSSVITRTEDASLQSGLAVYPNPFQNAIALSKIGEYTYRIHDMSGRLLLKGRGEGETILGESLENGMYLLEVQSNTGSQILKIQKK